MITQADLDNMMEAYVEAALWSTNESEEQGGEPLDANYSASDVEDVTLQAMRADCEKFARENESLLRAHFQSQQWGLWAMAGHDFWLTRNRHGVGFWDREEVWGASKDALTEAADAFGEVWIYVGDDGKIDQS